MKRRTGRPRKDVDWKAAEKLAALHCTGEEIAAFLDMSYDTLEKAVRRDYDCSFTEWFKNFSAKGKISLRRKQYETALSGNTALLIWLGKQYLSQTDKIEQDNKESVTINADFFSNLKNNKTDNNDDNKNDE